MRASLQESEARLGMALTAGGLGVWELDFATEELTATDQCKACFGYAPDAAFTVSELRAAIHPDDYPAQREEFERAVAARRDLRTECRCIWPDGTVHWIVMRAHALVDPDGRPLSLTCIVGDITDRREGKERLDRLQSDLAHIGRLTEMGEMGEMVSAFAHELRQPLTAANNYLAAAKRLLARRDAPAESAIEVIEKADGQFTRANDIIRRIRGFAGKKEAAKAPEDVAAMIGEACEIAQLDPRHRGVDVAVEIADGLPPALVDKVQIQQVLLNLLRNAFEATDGRDPRRAIVRAGAGQADGQIEVSVSDTGPGLAPEVAARLFQPFVTTKENGMGVGLSICRTIVEAHGGKMWTDSKPGHGATFFLTVPAVS